MPRELTPEERERLGLPPVSIIETIEDEPSEQTQQQDKGFFPTVATAGQSSYESTVVGLGKTGQLILERRAREAEERGDLEKAEELRLRAQALLERNTEREDLIKSLGSYQSKHGETGVEQVKNITDSNWWAQTIGEVVPGSIPFLTGAYAGGKAAALSPIKNPVAIIASAAVGGGLAVFAQEFGDAYVSYLEKNPGDTEGAESYAMQKSGFSAVINAASVPFGLFGIGKGAIKRALIQTVIQPNIGVSDVYVGNILEKQYIDPEKDLTEGLVKAAVGEGIFEGVATANIARKQYMGSKDDLQKIQDEFNKSVDEGVDQQAEQEIQTAFGDMSLDDLKSMPVRNTEFADMEFYPNDTQEIVLQKMKELRKEKIRDELAEKAGEEDVLSQLSKQKILRGKIEEFEQIPREDLFNQLMQEFAITDAEGNLDENETWDAYNFWASQRGYAPPSNFNEFVDPNTNIEADIFGLAEAATDRSMRRREGPVAALGVDEFNNYVDFITTQIPNNQLKLLYKRYIPVENQSNINQMSNKELAFGLAEFASILELQQRKESKTYVESQRPFKRILSKAFPKFLRPEGFERTFAHQVDENPNDPYLRKEMEPTGNALSARGEITNEDGTVETINFVRDGIEGMDFLDTLKATEGISFQDASQMPSNLGKLVDTVDGVSLDEIEMTDSNFRLTEVTFPENLLPQNQSDYYNKKIVGPWFKNFRPAGMTGLAVFNAIKSSEGRIRSLQYQAERLGYKINKAIAGAVRNKENNLTELEARLMFGSFIKQTNTYLPLTKDQVQGKKDEIVDIDRKLVENQDGYLTNEQVEALEIRKAGLQVDLDGPVPVKLAIRNLPKEMQSIARESRKKIDALSQRVLNENIGKELSEEERTTIEDAIGEYTTNILGFYETELGFNPKFDKSALGTALNFVAGDITFKKRKMAKELYNRAVTSVSVAHQNDPKFKQAKNDTIRRLMAENIVDNYLTNGAETAKTEILQLKSTLRSTSEANNFQMSQGLKLRPKKYMPYPIRKLLGEVTEKEPDILVASSFARVAQLVERNKFYNELLEINSRPGEMFLSPVRNDAAGFTHRIADDPLNPLSGMYTSKTYKQALETDSLDDGSVQSIVYRFYKNLFLVPKGLTQYGMVVISPGTQVRNFEGAFMMHAFTGNLFTLSSVGNISKAADMATSVLFPDVQFAPDGSLSGKGQLAEKINRIGREEGIMFTNSVTRDALGIFTEVGNSGFQSGDQVIHALYSMKHTPLGKFYQGTLGNVVKGMGTTYNLVDDFFKMLDYAANIVNIKTVLSRLDNQAVAPIPDSAKLNMLKDFSSTLTTNAGSYKTDAGQLYKNIDNLDDYTYKLAAWMTRNTMANYDFVGRFAQFVRQLPTGNFIAFPTEILRTSANNVQLAYKLSTYKIPGEIAQDMGVPVREVVLNKNEDGTTSEQFAVKRPFKGMGLQRYIGAALASYVVPKGLQVFAQFYYGVNDEELEALDEAAREYDKKGLKIPMSEIGPNGEIDYMNTTYTFPFADLMTSIETVKKEAESQLEVGAELPEAVTKGIWEGFSNYMESYYGISIAPRTMLELALNRDLDTDNPIYIETDSWGDKVKAAANHALQTSGPGGYRQMQKIVNAFATGDDRYNRYGKVQSKTGAFAGLAGVTIADVDPVDDIGFKINALKKAFEKGVVANMQEFKYQQDAKTAEEVLKQWDDAQKAWYQLQQEFYIEFLAYKTLGGDAFVREAMKQLKQRAPAGIKPSVFARNLTKGIFVPWDMPDSYRKNYLKIKNELGLKREWPTDELRERYRYLKPQGEKGVSLMASPSLPTPWTED